MIYYKQHQYRGVAWASAHFSVGYLAETLVGQSRPTAFQDPERIPWSALQESAFRDLIERKGLVEAELHHAQRVASLRPVPHPAHYACVEPDGCLCPDCRSQRRGG